MDLTEVVFASSEPQLSHGFYERRTLDITDSTTEFYYAYVWLFICIVHTDLCNPFNPILNSVREMGNNPVQSSQGNHLFSLAL